MSDLVFIAFENEKKAEEVRDKVLGMQKEYLIEVSDAVIATRDENGLALSHAGRRRRRGCGVRSVGRLTGGRGH
jgi:uncharacterized membrane protein